MNCLEFPCKIFFLQKKNSGGDAFRTPLNLCLQGELLALTVQLACHVLRSLVCVLFYGIDTGSTDQRGPGDEPGDCLPTTLTLTLSMPTYP